MRKIFFTTVALAVMAILVSSAQAAIKIEEAEIKNGAVHVEGERAQRNAAISWEGVALGINSNKGGAFKFNTTNLPPDCVGRLKIGTEERDVVIEHCTPADITVIEGGVLKTGQTNNFGVTGSDGDLQKGTARSYTSNAGGTITDNSTGLVWEKLTIDATIHNVNNSYNWANAFAVKIAALNTVPCFANSCDWRLPNVNELQTLADYGRVNPAIDPVFNNGVDSFTQLSNYWSSTTYQINPDFAWIVLFGDGIVFPNGKVFSNYVRAVRGGS